MAAPMDLNVPLCNTDKLIEKVKIAQKLGYEVVAINNIVPDLLGPKKKKSEQRTDIKPASEILLSNECIKKNIGTTRRPFRQISRLSTVLQSVQQTHILNSDEVQSYDLIAVQPTDEKTFRQACTNLNIDIITIDVCDKLDFKIKRATLNAAIEKGIHFELQYSHAIRDQTMRQHLISNAMSLQFFGKGKNVILTSGCEKAIEMRGPHDVANLGILLDLNEQQAKNATTKNCQTLLSHSESRRVIKSVMKVERTAELSPSDAWLMEKCQVEIDSSNSDCDTEIVNNTHSNNANTDIVQTNNDSLLKVHNGDLHKQGTKLDSLHREGSSEEDGDTVDDRPQKKKIKLNNT